MKAQLHLSEKYPWGRLITSLVNYKNIPITIHPPQQEDTIIYQDREIHLTDTLTIIDYIDERYPYPQLLPADIVKRNTTRNIVRTLMQSKNHETTTWIEVQLNEASNPKPQTPPTLLDFCIAQFVPTTSKHYPFWNHLI